jgi:hypothetical protein
MSSFDAFWLPRGGVVNRVGEGEKEEVVVVARQVCRERVILVEQARETRELESEAWLTASMEIQLPHAVVASRGAASGHRSGRRRRWRSPRRRVGNVGSCARRRPPEDVAQVAGAAS